MRLPPEAYPIGMIVELVRPGDWEGPFKDEWMGKQFRIIYNNMNGDITNPCYNLVAHPSGRHTGYYYDHLDIRPARPLFARKDRRLPEL